MKKNKKKKKKMQSLLGSTKEIIVKSNEITNADLQLISKIANEAAKTPFFEKLGGFPGIFSIMLYAKEIGLPPMQAIFGGMHSVRGKIGVAPHAMCSLIRGKGHGIAVLELTDLICTIKGTRRDTGETMTLSFSFDEATKAGLTRGDSSGWNKYTKDLLYARAMSRLGKRLFGDVIGCSTYSLGEIPPSIDEPLDDIEPIIDEYTVAKAAKKMSIELNIDNSQELLEYIEFCYSKTMRPLEALVPIWIEKKDLFLENFEKKRKADNVE